MTIAGVARWLAACCVWCLLANVAPRAAGADAAEVRAAVELFVNGTSCGDVIILLRDGTPWVPVETLRAAGLRIDRGTRAWVGDGGDNQIRRARLEYVSLATLAAAIPFQFDDRELQLRLIARSDQFQAQVFPIRTGPPQDLVRRRDTSAFLNYAAFAESQGTTVATDAGISLRGALLRLGGGRDTTGRFFRAPSRLTIDNASHLMRWDLGDSLAAGGLVAGTLPVLGISVSREFSIDPYFVRYTPLTLSGSAATPSVAEVYVNGQLVHRERIAPGSFTLSGLPVTVGAGQAEVVLRDAFGREQRLASTFYEPASLLRPGLQEFHYAAGVQRDESRLWRYQGFVASAAHRVGINEWLTLGTSANVAPRLATIEPAIATRAPLGEVEVRVAGARVDRRTGVAWLTAWSYRGRWLSGAITARRTSDSLRPPAPIASGSTASSIGLVSQFGGLVNAGEGVGAGASAGAIAGASASGAGILPSLFAPPRHQIDAQLGFTIGRGVSVSAGATDGEDWSAQRVRRQTVTLSVPATRHGNVMATYGRMIANGRVGYDATIGWTFQLSARSTMTAATRRADRQQVTQVSYQRALPVGSGVGGRVQWTLDGQDVDGTLQVQGDHGRIELRRDLFGGSASGGSPGTNGNVSGIDARAEQSVGVSGAIVAAGGHLFATRTIDDAFAVIKVGDVPGVRVYASNQLVGRTNHRGEAVVPNLVSYYGNRLSIAPEDVPITYAVNVQEYAIAPALRGGAVVRFEAASVRPVTGRFVIAGRQLMEPQSPAYGEARIEDAPPHEVSPLGRRGEFFFEQLEPGRHRARLQVDGFDYDCDFRVPDRRDALGRPIDLGEIVCVGPLHQADDQQGGGGAAGAGRPQP
jgi:outer membrane usher protein